MVDRMLPAAAVALERIVAAAGYEVGFPKAQWCCGLIAANAGDFKGADRLQSALFRKSSKFEGPDRHPLGFLLWRIHNRFS